MNSKELRQLALDTNDIRTAPVTCSQWPGFTAEARALSLADKIETVKSVVDDDGEVDRTKMIPLMVAKCLFSVEDGQRIFEDADAEALGQKSTAAMEEIWAVVSVLNGEGAVPVENAVKN